MKITDISKIRIDNNNVKYYTAIIYPKIEYSEDDIYEDIPAGFRLDNVADRYYGNSALWRIIAIANSLGKGTMIVPDDMIIRIPDPNKISNFLKNLEILNT
jgi:hypothetical protein